MIIVIIQKVLTYYVRYLWDISEKSHEEKCLEGWYWILTVGVGGRDSSKNFSQMKCHQDKYRGKKIQSIFGEWQIVKLMVQ